MENTEIPKVFFTGEDIRRATKGITNATMVSKATVVSKVIVAIVIQP
jgi:hypothetical protein